MTGRGRWAWALALAGSLAPGHVGAADGEVRGDGLYRACGLNCLKVVCGLKGVDASFDRLGELLGPNAKGESSIEDLERAARAVGLDPVSARVDLAHLARLPMPAIVHLRTRARDSTASHYVVLMGLLARGVVTIDPPMRATYHPYDEFKADWTGVVVAFPGDEAGRQAVAGLLVGTSPWTTWVAPALLLGSVAALLVARRGPASRPSAGRRGPSLT